jgi:hypothetical protein
MVRNEQEEYDLIRRHFKSINEHHLWKNSYKIFIPENNLGLEASHLHGVVQHFDDVKTYWQKPNRPGVVMTAESKSLYHKQMIGCLYNRKLRFERDFFTVSKHITPEIIKTNTKEQFEMFHWVKKPAKDNLSKDRFALTGKMGTKQDDCLISILQNYKYGLELISNPRHEVFSEIPEDYVKKFGHFINNSN